MGRIRPYGIQTIVIYCDSDLSVKRLVTWNYKVICGQAEQMSLLQVAKTFLRWRGKGNIGEIRQENQNKHSDVRRAISLNLPCEASSQEVVLLQSEDIVDNSVNNRFMDSTCSIKARTTNNTNNNNTSHAWKPKYHSQKVRGSKGMYEKKFGEIQQNRRKFSLKGMTSSRRKAEHSSCPDLSKLENTIHEKENFRKRKKKVEQLNANFNEETIDRLDRNTLKLFGNKQQSKTQLIEICIE